MHKAPRAKVVARILAIVALLLASAPLLAGSPLASAGAPVRVSAAQPDNKIAPEVLRATEAGQVAPIAILLADQADVSAAYSMSDRNARGRYVYNTLKAHADMTQAGLRAELDALGIDYTSFWVANVIFARGDRALVERLAARNDVKVIESNADRRMEVEPLPLPMAPGAPDAPNGPQAVEWNVSRVRAPEVWSLGYTGTDIVIGIQDTGVHWTHDALKPHYRGWNGASANHNYNWWDGIRTPINTPPTNECGYATTSPCDDWGHGTHVIGIALGDDAQGNQVGVAPGAKWIGCRNMDDGVGRPETYTECFQFFIAPTDLAGQNPNTDLRPHVMNNSWGCTPGPPPGGEGCAGNTLQAIVENTQAAGIMVVSSSGNSGPNCSSVEASGPPSIYEATFSTGSTDINNTLVSTSSRGPATYDGSNRVKPNISAPGDNIRSTLRGTNTGYGHMGGTSMASPHVAGVVALLWDAWPQLSRDITATKQILQNTANPGIKVNTGPTECGGVPNTAIPNNAFGYGLVDAYAAVLGYCEATSQDVRVGSEITPGNVTIPAGSTVRWTSEGGTHTSTSNTGMWDSGNIPPGGSFSHTFNTPGVYSYHCELHPNMAGTVYVTDPCSVTPTSTPTSSATSTSTATATKTSTFTSTTTATPSSTSTTTTQPSATTAISSPTRTATATATPQPSSSATPCPGTVDVRLGSNARSGPSGSCPPPLSPTPASGCSIQFADVPSTGEGSTFYSFVRCLACRSIVGGYPCGGPGEPCNSGNNPYFRPGANVTRGQIAKMVALAAGMDGAVGAQVFEDVPPGSTFYGPVQALATAGYIGGYPCGSVPGEPCRQGNRPYFRPGANATRGQLSKIVSETAQFSEGPGGQKFADVPENSPFFVWVNRLANRGVISGYTCGGPGEPCPGAYFRPSNNVTRGQTAKIVSNTFFPNCQTP